MKYVQIEGTLRHAYKCASCDYTDKEKEGNCEADAYTFEGDNRHTGTCKVCGGKIEEECTFQNEECTKCHEKKEIEIEPSPGENESGAEGNSNPEEKSSNE